MKNKNHDFKGRHNILSSTHKILRCMSIIKKFVFPLILLLLISGSVIGQPNPGSNGNNNPVGGPPIGGGSAPIGSGLGVLTAMAAAYGISKVIQYRKHKNKFLDKQQ